MKNELAPTASAIHDAILNGAYEPGIGERGITDAGFAAMLRRDALERDLPGIIGGPRVNPTGSGLWIEDSLPAAIGEITLVLLEDFLRREKADRRFAMRGEPREGAGRLGDAMAADRRAPNSRAPASPVLALA